MCPGAILPARATRAGGTRLARRHSMVTKAISPKRPAPRASTSKAKAPAKRVIRATDPIETFMTRSPHCIGKDQKLATAQTLMREQRLRHLPVLEGGKLIGMLSQRDIYFVGAIPGVDPGEDTVEDAMTQDAYRVSPSAQLLGVVSTMVDKKLGSAVVVQRGKVVGVFTTTDAMRLLTELLAGGAR